MKSIIKSSSTQIGERSQDNADIPGKSTNEVLDINYESMSAEISKIADSITFEELKKFYRL